MWQAVEREVILYGEGGKQHTYAYEPLAAIRLDSVVLPFAIAW